MIVITGGAGFIGSNLVHRLNAEGYRDLMVVDNLTDSAKFENLVGAIVTDYLDKEDFLALLDRAPQQLHEIEAIFHQGACTSTTETDGRYMMRNNFQYSRRLLEFCLSRRIPLIYASSGAVYGGSDSFREEPASESPLNVYGFSKLLFDSTVRRHLPEAGSQIVGLRYFNVYGPREEHKGAMASLVLQLANQLRDDGVAYLFGATEGYAAGEQRRDFVYVDDVIEVNLWFLRHPERSGIFNCGSGKSRTFNELAQQVVERHASGTIDYIPFPDSLLGRYQSFTEADLGRLRAAGYDREFTSIEEGVARYLEWRRRQSRG